MGSAIWSQSFVDREMEDKFFDTPSKNLQGASQNELSGCLLVHIDKYYADQINETN